MLFGLEDKNTRNSGSNSNIADEEQFDHFVANINIEGKKLEKEGKIDEAIKIYEKGLAYNTDTPHTYKRLAILYRKKKDPDNEMRVIKAGMANVNKKSTHYDWFQNRKEKLE